MSNNTLSLEAMRAIAKERVCWSLVDFLSQPGESAIRVARVSIGQSKTDPRADLLTTEITLITEKASFAGRGADALDALSEVLQQWRLRP